MTARKWWGLESERSPSEIEVGRYVQIARYNSKVAVYRAVAVDRERWAKGALRSPNLTVYVDESDGRGWQVYERINLADGAS